MEKVTKIATIVETSSNVYLDDTYSGNVTYLKLGSNLHLVVQGVSFSDNLITSPIIDFDHEYGLVYTSNSVYLVEVL